MIQLRNMLIILLHVLALCQGVFAGRQRKVNTVDLPSACCEKTLHVGGSTPPAAFPKQGLSSSGGGEGTHDNCWPCYDNQTLINLDVFKSKPKLTDQRHTRLADRGEAQNFPSFSALSVESRLRSASTNTFSGSWPSSTLRRHRHRRSRPHHRRKKRPQIASHDFKDKEYFKPVLVPRPSVGDPSPTRHSTIVGSFKKTLNRRPIMASVESIPDRTDQRSKETVVDQAEISQPHGKHISKKAELTVDSLSAHCEVVSDKYHPNRIIQLNCSDKDFTNFPNNLRFMIPDAHSVRFNRVNFTQFWSMVVTSVKASSQNIYIESSNVTQVADIFQIFDSSDLLTLNLSQNLVTGLDKKTMSAAPKLEYFSVGDNEIRDLAPDTFYGNPNLIGIHLRGNKLTSLPQSVFQKNGLLEEITLDNNQIATLPNRSFYGLRKLMYFLVECRPINNDVNIKSFSHLSNNNLTDQLAKNPGIFLGCSHITILTLGNCQISSFHADTFGSLTSLVTLVLANNYLTQIPDGAFQNLHKLKTLHLENNLLVSVASEWYLPASIAALYLSDNLITHVNDSLNGLDLTFLYLDGNKLETLNTRLQMYLAGIKNLTVYGNPWRCDCDLIFLIHFVKAAHGSLNAATICETPMRVRMRDLADEIVQCPLSKDCGKSLQRKISGQCLCMEGTFLDKPAMKLSKCSACPQQTYKNTTGDGGCMRCSSGSIPVSGPAPLCSCAAGFYTNSDGDCERCPEGTYKTFAGVGLCTACKADASNPGCASRQQGHVQDQSVSAASTQNEFLWPVVIAATCVIVIGVIIIFGLFGRRYRARRRLWQIYCGKMNSRTCSIHAPAVDEVRFSSASNNSSSTDFRCNSRHSLRIKDIGGMIGRGAFGQVFEANAYLTSHDRESIKVAVKKLKDTATDEEIKNLREEMEQMMNVGPHPNIIGLFGSVFFDGQYCIIMEYAELGDLLTYLKTECAFPLQYVSVSSDGLMVEQSAPKVEDNANLMLFAWQISKGMRHLEMHRVIHRDLATRNCLLTKGPIAKVSDFGLSKDAYELGHYKRIQKDRVPFKWLSPEALLWGQYSSKSDVWAFGVLLWELYTFGGTPYPQVTTEQLRELHEYGYRMSKPPACPDPLYRIMRACWREDARQRPSFKQLEETLDHLIQQTRNVEYIDLHLHGLKTSNPLPSIPEDKNDQVTSLDYIYTLKKQSLYQYIGSAANQAPQGDDSASYTSVRRESGDSQYDATFSMLMAGITNPEGDRESESTVTSGFLSMTSTQTM